MINAAPSGFSDHTAFFDKFLDKAKKLLGCTYA
jgi:hypothetical protein